VTIARSTLPLRATADKSRLSPGSRCAQLPTRAPPQFHLNRDPDAAD